MTEATDKTSRSDKMRGDRLFDIYLSLLQKQNDSCDSETFFSGVI